MKTKFTILLALCLALFASCKPTPAVPYEHSGIALICPQGWEITGEKHEDNGHHLFIEKTGYNASGLITVTWVDQELEWEDYMDTNMEVFERKTQLQELNFSEPLDTFFNGYMALTASYTFNTMNVPHSGKILILGDDERTINIVLQEADEDNKKNKDGFAAFMESFVFL